ncbi:NAD/NADP octopine/nopaline dehydrogenase family protein [Actinomadura barringtoniae]|uniref:NAD/NADP octopine/nopaline dehydrogenase family protein n=1 Tax=Actinomadura barringtoniae TaxID=1427535 RepID=A0A939PMX1_9ACTN|nr:NAD/NADP-dependent octopine/nopaline dehydrogenase family protein [Actinomadura barringtoniae]MBO2455741.1 NAD/NADP octopine/nopaline dehydrogenase family protein [Actinomadura barringtoniae]
MSKTTVAVLGAGAGGLSAVVELTLAGHDVRLWNRNPMTLAPFSERKAVPYAGVQGDGEAQPQVMTTDLAEALQGADVAVVCLPSIAHRSLFIDLARLPVRVPIVLNPGHTGGALHARAVFAECRAELPPLAEFSTLTYVARVKSGVVVTTGRAGTVRAACLPGGQDALDYGLSLFRGASAVPDVLASSLSNVNLVLHPPGAVLGAAWVEATGGDFTFYVEGMTAGVARVLTSLDEERRAVARAFGHALPGLLAEMTAIGTADPVAAERGDVVGAVSGGAANRQIAAPSSFAHRYYREDLPYGLLPFTALAGLAGVPVPTAHALLTLGATATGEDPAATGLDAARLGLGGLDVPGVLAVVRGLS